MNEEEREIVKKFERLYLKDFNNEKITNEDRLSYMECVLISNLIEKLQKENEELKEYNMTYKRILGLADNRIYRKKYLEERRKEQPNLLYPDSDEIYRRYYELKEENEHLHRYK